MCILSLGLLGYFCLSRSWAVRFATAALMVSRGTSLIRRKRADHAVVPTFPILHQPIPSSSARVSEAGKNLVAKYGLRGVRTPWPALARQASLT